MTGLIHLVTTCSNRKKAVVGRGLELRRFNTRALPDLARHWICALTVPQNSSMAAADLYAGEMWSNSLKMTALAQTQNHDVQSWVLSAGYGLIPHHAKIKPYAATFTGGHEDSIHRGAASPEASREWWRLLSEWPGPEPGLPRTLTEIALGDPTSQILVVAAPPYLRAIHDDLVSAAEALQNRDRLVIVSSKQSIPAELRANMVMTDAVLQHYFGGSCIGLNVRVAMDIVENLGRRRLSARHLAPHYARLVAEAPSKPVAPKKSAATEAQVIRFLHRRLKKDPTASRSALHTEFRLKYACSQERFKAVFEKERPRGNI